MKINYPRSISKYYYFKTEMFPIRSREEFVQTLRRYLDHPIEISTLIEDSLPGVLLSDVLAIIVDPNKKFISALIFGEFDEFNSIPAYAAARKVVVTSNSRDIQDICEDLQKMLMDHRSDAEQLLSHKDYSDLFFTLLHDLQTIDDATFNILKQTLKIQELNTEITNMDREINILKKKVRQLERPNSLYEYGFYSLLDHTSTSIYEQQIREIISELKEDCNLFYGAYTNFVEKTVLTCKKQQMLPEDFNVEWHTTFDALLYFKAYYAEVYQLFLSEITSIYIREVLDIADVIQYIAINYSQDKQYVLAELTALLKDSFEDQFESNVYNLFLFLPSNTFATNFKRSIDEHIV